MSPILRMHPAFPPKHFQRTFSPHADVIERWPVPFRNLFQKTQKRMIQGCMWEAPRFVEPLTPGAYVERWDGALAGYQTFVGVPSMSWRTKHDLLCRMSEWPEEYQTRFFDLLAWNPDGLDWNASPSNCYAYLEAVFGKRPTEIQFQKPNNICVAFEKDGADRRVFSIFEVEVRGISNWLASFQLPMKQGSGWRRLGATISEALRFHKTFRSDAQGSINITLQKPYDRDENHALEGTTIDLPLAILKKAQTWARSYSHGLWIETKGSFLGMFGEGHKHLTVVDFLPAPSINADIWLLPMFRGTPFSLTPGDLQQPLLLQQMFPEQRLEINSRDRETIVPTDGFIPMAFHSHPLHWASGADRISYADPLGARFIEFVWTPLNGLLVYCPIYSGTMPSEKEYATMTAGQLEALGMFQRVANDHYPVVKEVGLSI